MTDDTSPTPRPEVLAVSPTHHGALDYAELERLAVAPDEILDFSVNSNPYGPSPRVWPALKEVPLDRYPDREALALRRHLTARLDVALEQIVAGNGTAELIWLLALAFVRPGDAVLVLGPTFGEYVRAAALMGGTVHRWNASAESAFAVIPGQIATRLAQIQPRVVFLCTPNNPTGTAVDPDQIAEWAQAYPATLFVVDEAYLAFAPGAPSAQASGADNVLVLRSMTKDYGLAGLRLGYAVGDERIVAALTQVRPPWNVNSLAQAAGVAALEDEAHTRRTLAALQEAKEGLVAGLEDLGLAPYPSATHFFLVPVEDGAAFRRALLDHKVQVRDCASFGLPTCVRIGARRPEENGRLLAAVQAVIQ